MPLIPVNAGCAEANSITIPAGHQIGDLLLMFAFRDGSVTVPTVPSGWTSLGTDTQTSPNASSAIAWKIATSSADTSGTWTGTTNMVCAVFRGQATNKTPVFVSGVQKGSSTTVSYNGLSPMKCPGTSQLIAFIGHTSIDTTLETPPAGMTNWTNLAGVTAEVAAQYTNGVISAFSTTNVSVGGTSGAWIEKTIEILAEQLNMQNYMGFDVGDGMSTTEKIR